MKTFNLDKEYLDEEYLNYLLSHSQLWHLREILISIYSLLELKVTKQLKPEDYIDAHRRMYYLSNNIFLIEEVLIQKESSIFEITEYGEMCFN
jgi:hypothetical protein